MGVFDCDPMTLPRTRVIVDLSNIVHMCWSMAQKTDDADPGRYEPLELFKSNLNHKLRSVSNAILKLGIVNAEFIFVRDETSMRKIVLYSEYKAHRNGGAVPIAEAVALIRENSYGRICFSPMNEADDAIATLACNGGGIIVSMDRDLWQLMDYTDVVVFNPLTKALTTREDVLRAFGLEHPSHIALYKALWGDAGDNIPNAIPRMQKALLPLIAASSGTLDDFTARLQRAWWELTPRCRQLYTANKEQIQINWELVCLDRWCEIVWE